MRFFRRLLIVLAPLALLASFYRFDTPPKLSAPVATYSHGLLRVSLQYNTVRPLDGSLTLEVLDPDDKQIAHSEQVVKARRGQSEWVQKLRLSGHLAIEDLVWYRLRCRLRDEGRGGARLEQIDSLSDIVRVPVTHVIAQKSYLAGAPAAVRVIVTDSQKQLLPETGKVRIDLEAPQKQSVHLFTGTVNSRGTADAHFLLPAGFTGASSLRFVVDTAIGSTEFTEPIQIEDKVSILLTTEKPIYQPGQTIHIRALALDRSGHDVCAGRKLEFELEDSRGNKVFKRNTKTDTYGIASAEFTLADEVNLGTYHLRAFLNKVGESAPDKTELALNVERYVLPKFKVAIDLAENGSKAKRGYRPGDHVKGTVRANYFFGRPIDGGEITVKASAIDVAEFDAGSSQGKTDADGAYRFDIHLPDYFAGRPLAHGAARVLIEAAVKDSSGHTETRGEPITVSASPLLITAVPEGGELIPGLENQVFILTSYADGTPAQADVRVEGAQNPVQTAKTDEAGVAVVQLHASSANGSLRVEASDRDGSHTSIAIPIEQRSGSDQILLRTERAVYRVGERMHLKLFSTRQAGSAYVDVIKDGQTVETRDLDLVNGQASLDIAATPALSGTVEFNAYLFGENAVPVGDHRLVFVQPADELKVETALDCPEYKPGGEARIAFRVTNAKGEGVQAALGLQIVDEAVFALAEKQPRFAKVFFYLEQEAMKPRYEIHSIDMRDAVTSAQPGESGARDLAARALFSATDLLRANTLTGDFGADIRRVKFDDYMSRYRARFQAGVEELTDRLNAELEKGSGPNNLSNFISRVQAGHEMEFRDSWGDPLRIESHRFGDSGYISIRSAGPDKQFNTEDDLAAYLQVQSWIEGRVANPGKITLDLEHDRGAVTGLAQITGFVDDPSGAAVPNATVNIREKTTGKIRTSIVNVHGQFTFAGIPPGTYNVQISSPGFRTAERKNIRLQAQDRAVLNTTLDVGLVTQAVVITGADGAVAGVVGGIGGRFMLNDGTHLGAGNAPVGVTINKSIAAEMAPPPPIQAPAASPAVHVRSFFPEALYINPEIITDHEGRATITVPLADNITDWRIATLASTPRGALGNAASSLKVFQDFFVDLDLPVVLTQGDQVSIPVAVYNYAGSAGRVNLHLQLEDWFSLEGDAAAKTIDVAGGRVGGSQFTLEARRIGKFKLTLRAQMSGSANRADIVVREIEVVPNGREQDSAFNGHIESSITREVSFPAASIPDARTIFVRLYPGPLSQVLEGMEGLLQMPFGCFEQTSSATYPNVLALDYMKRTNKLTPEVHAKAEGFIANGYQRLLTFEVPGGGFSWFGQAPANKILTSYGLMEFSDMAKIYQVDDRVITRTQRWLAGQQQSDGSWKPDESFINEGATIRYNSNLLRITAYLAWSLENTGFRDATVEKAKRFIERHLNANADTYTLAVAANFAVDYGKDPAFTRQVIKLLLDARTEKDEQASWNADETAIFATGKSAAIETTGLATQALLKWGEEPGVTRKAIAYLTATKAASGTWGSTQATILALRALLLATEKSGASATGAVEIVWNGKPAGTLALTEENNELLHQFVLKSADIPATNVVEIRFAGRGGLSYQIAGRSFLSWDQKPAAEPLSIAVAYDRTHLKQDDIATATATVRNNLDKRAEMVMVDLGIPPGFELLSEDLQSYQEKSVSRASGRLEKFNQTATQAILYFDSIAPHDAFSLSYRLRAKYPIRARSFESRVYEYYDPDVNSVARPVQLEVARR